MTRIVTLLCALYLSGAHWAILQSAAWAGMIVERSKKVGFSTAMLTTFDGAHPCRMCKAIEKSRDTEQQQQSATRVQDEVAKQVFLRPLRIELPMPAEVAVTFDEVRWNRSVRNEVPPTPPPRLS